MKQELIINHRAVGNGHPAYIIAEIAGGLVAFEIVNRFVKK